MVVKNIKITLKQQQIYDFIKKNIKEKGESPSVYEIRDFLGVQSLRTVTQHLEALERKGLIRRIPHRKRNIQLIEQEDKNSDMVVLPVMASAGCDHAAVIADQNFDEYMTVEKTLLPKGKKVVLIKAIGDSMIDAGIQSGDLVVTEVTDNVGDNDRVVAIIDDVAVIKKLEQRGSSFILSPESRDKQYHSILLQDKSKIFGKVIDVIKVGQKIDEPVYIDEKQDHSQPYWD